MGTRPFRRGGGGRRRDKNEPDIVKALRQVGCAVWQIGGTGLPDLLVRVPGSGRWVPLEVKSADGDLTEAQRGIVWAVVRTPEDAISAVWGR